MTDVVTSLSMQGQHRRLLPPASLCRGACHLAWSRCAVAHDGLGSLTACQPQMNARGPLSPSSKMLRTALRSLSSLPRASMQAIVVSALGDSSSLQLRGDVPVPVAPPGHLLVKLQYSGVNFIDTYFRSGLYATQLPYIPGDSKLFHF